MSSEAAQLLTAAVAGKSVDAFLAIEHYVDTLHGAGMAIDGLGALMAAWRRLLREVRKEKHETQTATPANDKPTEKLTPAHARTHTQYKP